MKKLLILTFTVFASITLCFAQTRGVSKYGEMLFEGRPFFTDSALYNSYDLGGSPLGMFEKGSPKFDARFGNRSTGLGGGSENIWDAPSIIFGSPGQSYFNAFYKYSALSDKGDDGNGVNLPLNKFGLVLASQGTSGAMRASFLLDGFYGRQEWNNGDSVRVIMGFERLRLDVGSQVHPLLRVGMYVGTAALFDTLAYEYRRDRSFHINLPEFGANLDIGGEEFPVRSNIDFSYALSRFTYSAYATKGVKSGDPKGIDRNDNINEKGQREPGKFVTPPPDTAVGGDANAVLNDSLSIFWAARAGFPLPGDKLAIKPGLFVGYTSNSGDLRVQNPNDDALAHVVDVGDVILGSTYSLNTIWFGVGTGFEAIGYVNAYVEYSLAAMWLYCDSLYTGAAFDASRTIHHTAVGVSTRINDFVEMPVVITPRMAFFVSGITGAGGAARMRLGIEPLNNVSGLSKRSHYEPQNLLSEFKRVSGFTLGADGYALEGSVNASVWITVLSSNVNESGMEFGLRMGFLLK